MTGPDPARSRLWGRGSVVTVELTARETGGVIGVVRFRAVRGERAQRHVHTREDEIFLINDGEMRMTLGERAQVHGAGALFLPRGIPHSYEVLSPTADFCVLTTPGGFERFFQAAGFPLELADEAPIGDRWDPARVRDMADMLALGLSWCAEPAVDPGQPPLRDQPGTRGSANTQDPVRTRHQEGH